MTWAYSPPSQIFKMGRFAKIINGKKSLTNFAKRSILDVWQGSEYVFGWSSRLDWSSKCVLLWKPSVFIIQSNQSKIKIIPHTVFETFINNSFWYKTEKVSWWVLGVGDARNIHKSSFIKNNYWNLKLSIVALLSVIKCSP